MTVNAVPNPDVPVADLKSGLMSRPWYDYFLYSDYTERNSTGAGALLAANNLSDLPSVSTARTNLGLGGTLVTVSGHALALGGSIALAASDVGLAAVTNDAQTKAAIVPNTAPAAGKILVGNAGGTAYAPSSVSGDATLASTGALTVTKLNGVSPGAFFNGTDAANLTGTINNARLSAIPNTALASSSITISGHLVSLGGTLALVAGDVGLGSVTNDAQTKAAIVPNTAPSAGQVLVGNAGGTAYAPVSASGDVTIASTGAHTLAASGVTAATYGSASQVPQITVDAKGRVTAASNVAITGGSSGGVSSPGGRITLATGVPVMTTTQSAQTTIYYTPYVSRSCPLYDGTSFSMVDLGGELSQLTTDTTKSPAAVAANKNYDLFVWTDAGTLRCTRGPAWSSDTSRGTGAGTTELERIQGVLLNKNAITNGPAADRGTYVGTVRSNGSSQIDFIVGGLGVGGTAGLLGVWNMYNRVNVGMLVQNSTDTWTYNTRQWRAPNGSAGMRVSFVRGMDEDFAAATYYALGQAVVGGDICSGVGLDSTSAATGVTGYASAGLNQVPFAGHYIGNPGLGWHFVSALETQLTTGSGAATFFGDAGLPGEIQAGFSVHTRF